MSEDPYLDLWSQTLGTENLDSFDPQQSYKFAGKARPQAAIHVQLPTLLLTEEESRGTGSAVPATLLESDANTVLEDDQVRGHLETVSETPAASSISQPSLNHYELFEEIGRGGMGVIYRAKQRSLGREVAIKKVRSTAQDEQFLAKFASEARVTGELDHPNIVPVYDLGRDDQGRALLVMKLIGGMEWRALLHPKSKEEQDRAASHELVDHLRIMMTVCNALAYAHDKGVIHADLKPENIMIGQYGEVFLMDWGVAIDVREQAPATVDPTWIEHKSTVRHPRGTPVYMPPELAKGDGPQIGVWTDVYLLGAILFEILTGSPPHRAKNLTEVLKRARLAEEPDFSTEVPEELRDICRRAMNRVPHKRFESVIEFRRALEDYLEHRESIRIADRAELILTATLEDCLESCVAGIRNHYELYSRFAEAVAGFSQAQMLWPGNLVAQSAEHQARLSYARLALTNGDYGLAEAQAGQLPETCPTSEDLRREIRVAIHERRQREEEATQAIDNERRALEKAQKMLAIAFLEKARSAQARGDVLAGKVFSARALTIDSLPEARNLLIDFSLLPGSAVWQSRPGEIHKGPILDFAFDPSGTGLVTIGQDCSVIYWDMTSAPKARLLEQLSGEARCVSFHPSGDSFVVGYQTGEIKAWDPASHRLLALVEGHKHSVRSLDFSANGEELGSVCEGGEFQVRAFDKQNGPAREPRTRRKTEHGIIYKVLYNHCFKSWATAGEDGVVRFWDAAQKESFQYSQHNGPVYDFIFTHCGQMCATAGADNQVKLWRSKDGFLLLAYHVPGIQRIAFAN
ncbi:MAG: serine/threonine-protein kinase, partial [Planctomycetota bacterium]|nr:serine/threonine-protein kinase [Planctomycetota bacterium]